MGGPAWHSHTTRLLRLGRTFLSFAFFAVLLDCLDVVDTALQVQQTFVFQRYCERCLHVN